MTYDCVIVGAGPAGIAAAVQLQRAGFDVLIIERNRVGGLLHQARRLENFLGFPEGISGRILVRKFARHLQVLGLRLMRTEVTRVSNGHTIRIETKNGEIVRARCVIIATGTTPKHAGLPGEKELSGQKVFHELTELPRGRSRRIAIIGGGDIGCDWALSLRDRGDRPFILTRTQLQCISALATELRSKHIPFLQRVTIRSLSVEADIVVIHCHRRTYHAQYVLIAVGREPVMPEIHGRGRGVFFAGDVRSGKLRQTHSAAGDGLRAAQGVMDFLKKR